MIRISLVRMKSKEFPLHDSRQAQDDTTQEALVRLDLADKFIKDLHHLIIVIIRENK